MEGVPNRKGYLRIPCLPILNGSIELEYHFGEVIGVTERAVVSLIREDMLPTLPEECHGDTCLAMIPTEEEPLVELFPNKKKGEYYLEYTRSQFRVISASLLGIIEEIQGEFAELSKQLVGSENLNIPDFESYKERLTVLFVRIDEQLSLIIKIEEALRLFRVNQVEKQSIEMMNDFLRALIHDLRNTITPVSGWLQMLESSQSDDIYYLLKKGLLFAKEFLPNICSELKNVSDLLVTKFRVLQVVSEVAKDNDSINIHTTQESCDPEITSVSLVVKNIFHQIISNAARLATERGLMNKQATVSIEEDQENVRVSISDSCGGMSTFQMNSMGISSPEQIFKPGISSREKGGQGLSLAANLAHKIGGNIEARNHYPIGLEIIVTLPINSTREQLASI
jgi:signal transduction histidine kinase